MKKNKGRSYKRLVLGDVIEIPLSKGDLAYAQFVYNYREKPVWGHLIRVLPGTFKSRPESFQDLVEKEERFYAFFPAGAAVSRGIVEIVSREKIPEHKSNFPLFKSCNQNFKTGKKTWWLWDGKKSWSVGELSPEHFDLPLEQIVSFDVLVDRIQKGWSPRDEV